MLVRVGGFLAVARFGQELFVLFLPNVAQALVEQQTENILLVVTSIDGAAKNVRRAPQVALKFLLRQLRHYYPKCTARARARGELSGPGHSLSMLDGVTDQPMLKQCNGLQGIRRVFHLGETPTTVLNAPMRDDPRAS